jgi:hypothetical protein
VSAQTPLQHVVVDVQLAIGCVMNTRRPRLRDTHIPLAAGAGLRSRGVGVCFRPSVFAPAEWVSVFAPRWVSVFAPRSIKVAIPLHENPLIWNISAALELANGRTVTSAIGCNSGVGVSNVCW